MKHHKTQDIAQIVQRDIESRAELGKRKYGARLIKKSRENGKAPLVNLYEEILDSAMYIRQLIEELEDGEFNKPLAPD